MLYSPKRVLGGLGRQKQELIMRVIPPNWFKQWITPLELLKYLTVLRSGFTFSYLFLQNFFSHGCHTFWASQMCESKWGKGKNCKKGKWKKTFFWRNLYLLIFTELVPWLTLIQRGKLFCVVVHFKLNYLKHLKIILFCCFYIMHR